MNKVREAVKDGAGKNAWNQSDTHNELMEGWKDAHRKLHGGWNRKGRDFDRNYDRIFRKDK